MISEFRVLNILIICHPSTIDPKDQFITDINEDVDTTFKFIPSNETFPVASLPEGKRNILLILVSSLCGAFLLVMFVICVVLTLVFLKLVIKRASISSTSQARFLEDESGHDFTDEEISDIQCKCNHDELKLDLSLMLSDKSGIIEEMPVYDNITSC